MKAIDSFLAFLDEHKLNKMTPNHYTESEIISFANSKGFIFSKKSLRTRIEQLTQHNKSLSKIEQSWVVENK